MLSYYSSIILLSWMALGVLCVLIHENDRIPRADKRLLYLTYGLIALSALAEWCGVRLNGREDIPSWALKLAKCLDYIMTPMAGGALVLQMRLRDRWRGCLIGLLAINTLFQIVSLFTGWMIRVDAHNHYTHGPMYGAYLILCVAIIGLVIIAFTLYGRSFKRQNRTSLYAIMLLVVVGIALQEGLEGGPRTAYLGMTLGAALMFIHYAEFTQLAADEHVSKQQIQIDTDALTGVYSRHAYNGALKAYDAAGALPEDLAAFTIDLNGLKQINDEMGHKAGDELICGAADCVRRAFGDEARCYRTGGDEFVVLADMDGDQAEAALSRLRREASRWHGSRGQALSLAAGYALAADAAECSAEKLVRAADQAMYANKAAYYRNHGIDRRRK